MDLAGYAHDCLTILTQCIDLYQAGQRPFYRVAAVQLRMLLCDTTRVHGEIVDIALAARLWPDLALHPASWDEGRLVFDRSQPPLPRRAWLDQVIRLSEGEMLTLRQVIRLVCDRDGGAHADPPRKALPDLAPVIMAIGEYMVEEIGG